MSDKKSSNVGTANFSPILRRVFERWANGVDRPKKYTPSEWAEEHFVIPANGGNAEPGKFRFNRTPYLKEIVDTCADPYVEDVVFIKPTRVGGTTAAQIALGYWIANEPGDVLTVMPSEDAAKEEIDLRVRPMLELCPSLKQHMSASPKDNTLSEIHFPGRMRIYTGWSGSPQSLGSKTCRYVRLDETDKYVGRGREAPPLLLAKERTGTWPKKKHYITSTPTDRQGPIWKAWESCGDRRYFHVPCPHCGGYQRLVWAQVKWEKIGTDKIKAADLIEQTPSLAWYECSHQGCKKRIGDQDKPKMLERGVWLSDGQSVVDGNAVGDRPRSKRVGFHLNSLYSPWRTLAAMAAEWIRAEGDIELTMNFRNSRLAEPFEVQIAATDVSAIRVRCRDEKDGLIGPEPDMVPEWTRVILATADVQADRLYYVIRAWGLGFRSQLLRYGCVLNFSELRRMVFETPCILNGRHVFADRLAVDGRYRKNEVVEFQKTDVHRIWRTLGLPHFNAPMAKASVEQGGLGIVSVNTLLSKDRLSMLIADADKTRWMPNRCADDDYLEQMASEHKIWDRDQKREVWKQKTSGRDNHYWDCEANQCAIATLMHMDVPAEVPSEPAPAVMPAQSDRQAESSWLPERPQWF